MNKLNRIIVRALSLAFVVAATTLPGFGATHTVNVGNNFFNPAQLTIAVGDTVEWRFIQGTHNSTSTQGLWSSGNKSSGTFSRVFSSTGSFPYVCTLHSGQSGTITVQAPPNQPPTVSITSPSAGATFTAPASVTITATASDPDGSVASVEFFDGGTSLGVDTSSPYSVTATLQAGTHNLTAKATDNSSASTTSAAVQVIVNAPNQPPTVSITSPSNGATFTAPASVTITATANDLDGSVASVEFFDGGTSLGVDTSSPYTVTATLQAGTHNLTAKATDNAGAPTTSAAVQVIVNAPNQPPTVSITSPANGATFTAPASVTITATASDPDGSVASVEFFAGGTSLGVDTSSPYSVTATLQAGTHNLTAKATDNAAASTTSATIQVTVSAPLAPARLLNPQRLPDGRFQFTIEGVTGGRYAIHATGALPGGWSILETVTAPSATFNYVDQGSAGTQRRFYRAETVP